MRTKLIVLVGILMVLVLANAQGQNQSEFNLRFRDIVTGYSVIPDHVEIKPKEGGKFEYSIAKNQVSPNGTVSIRVAKGEYNISVLAEGYAPMTSDFKIENGEMNVGFELQSLLPRVEFSIPYIQSLQRKDAMVIYGSVVDDVTGKPMANVEVHTADKIVKTTSNEKGFFQLVIPLAENKNILAGRGVILFGKGDI